MSRLWSICPFGWPAIPVGAFPGWMALTVRAEADLGAAALVGFGVGDAALLCGDGEAVTAGGGAATGLCEAGGLDGALVDGLEELCCDTGAAVQATIQTTRTPARQPARCGDIARKDNVPPPFAGPMRIWAGEVVEFSPGGLRGAARFSPGGLRGAARFSPGGLRGASGATLWEGSQLLTNASMVVSHHYHHLSVSAAASERCRLD
jgi:hypothetical protein